MFQSSTRNQSKESFSILCTQEQVYVNPPDTTNVQFMTYTLLLNNR